MVVFNQVFGKSSLFPERLPEWETLLYRFMGRCWLRYTAVRVGDTDLRKPLHCGAQRSSNSSCHRPNSASAQTPSNKALPR